MRAFVRSYHEKTYSFVGTLCGGFIVVSLAIAAPAFAAGDADSGSETPAPRWRRDGRCGRRSGRRRRWNGSSLEEPIRPHDLPAGDGVGHEAEKVPRQA